MDCNGTLFEFRYVNIESYHFRRTVETLHMSLTQRINNRRFLGINQSNFGIHESGIISLLVPGSQRFTQITWATAGEYNPEPHRRVLRVDYMIDWIIALRHINTSGYIEPQTVNKACYLLKVVYRTRLMMAMKMMMMIFQGSCCAWSPRVPPQVVLGS